MKHSKTVRIGIGLSLIASFFALGYLMAPGGATTVKEALKAVDLSVTGGWTRRALNGEVLPDLALLETQPQLDEAAYLWLEDGPTAIAHGGGPSVVSGLNSLETIRSGYEMGFRLIEVDIWQTSNDALVCSHDAPGHSLGNVPFERSMDADAEVKSDVCTFDALVEFTESRPDSYVVLDIKTPYRSAISIMSEKLVESSRKGAFIPQIYSFEDVKHTRDTGLFSGEIFTSYVSTFPTS